MNNNNSLQAYRDLRDSGKLGKYQYKALKHIILNPGCTGNDISDNLGPSYRKRIAELKEMGLVRISGMVKNRSKLVVTGQTNPSSLFKPMTLKTKYDILLATVRKLHKDNSLDMFGKIEIEKMLIRIGVTL